MNRIETEKKVVGQMIKLYCRKNHRVQELCPDCRDLLEYAENRLDRCPQAPSKPSCRKCTIHCYSPDYREKIRTVMRQVGPVMIFYHPISALRHILSELR